MESIWRAKTQYVMRKDDLVMIILIIAIEKHRERQRETVVTHTWP